MEPTFLAAIGVFILFAFIIPMAKKYFAESDKKLENERARASFSQGTPLYISAHEGNKESLVKLINDGVDVNERSEPHGGTALHGLLHAYTEGRIKSLDDLVFCVNALIDAGINLNTPTHTGVTPLHGAALIGQPELVSLLVSHNANINAIDGGGGSPLMCSIASGNIEVIKYLISQGADVKIKCPNGESLIDFARNKGQSNVAMFLVQTLST
jgi:uncharacterized protein